MWLSRPLPLLLGVLYRLQERQTRSKREPGIRFISHATHHQQTDHKHSDLKRLAAGQTVALGEILGRYWHLLNLASVEQLPPHNDTHLRFRQSIWKLGQVEFPMNQLICVPRRPYEPTWTPAHKLPALSSETGINSSPHKKTSPQCIKICFKASPGVCAWTRWINSSMGMELLSCCRCQVSISN